MTGSGDEQPLASQQARSQRPGRLGVTLRDAIVRAVRALQPGEVVSYGEIARRAGFPGRARSVGNVLASHPDDDLPWWRVVRADGHLAAPNTTEQQRLLEAEDVDVVHGRVCGGVP